MRFLVLLLLVPFVFACQQVSETGPPLTANVGYKPVAVSQQSQESTPQSAINIVFQSVDGGQTWQDVSAGLPPFDMGGSVLVDNGKIMLGFEDGLYSSVMGGGTPKWENEFFIDKRITAIFPGRNGPYACSFDEGFFREMPGLGVWIPMHNALEDKRIQSVLETKDGSLIVCCHSGIYKSSDEGKSWKSVFDGSVPFDVMEVDGVLLSCGGFGVIRSEDGGEHWDLVVSKCGAAYRMGLIEGGIAALSHDGSSGKLHTSTDHGKTWKSSAGDRSSVRFMADLKQVGKYQFYSGDKGVFRSSDQGKTWELVLPAIDKTTFDLAGSGEVIYAIRKSGC